MNREDILRMALEAGIDYSFGMELERFAALVAEAEQEACAKAREATKPRIFRIDGEEYDDAFLTLSACASAIHARGTP